jgi:hypothetical protein
MSRLCLWAVMFSITALVSAQSAPPSDPQAVTMAAQSVATLTGGSALSDATLSGAAIWSVGSDQQTGTATLMAKGFAESRVDLNLTGGISSEIRNTNKNLNDGNWIGVDGAVHAIALHNCFTDASWFFFLA